MSWTQRTVNWLGIVLVGLVVAGWASPSGAASYPCKSVEWIVGWGAGGGSDIFARSIAPGLSENLGVPVKVTNMKGASSVPAQEETIKRPADGCTIFSITPSLITNELTGLTDLSTLGTLTPVFRAHVDVGMLYSKEGGKFETWEAVAVYTKANEGKLLIGGTGTAGFDEIVANVVMQSAGATFRYLPYESASKINDDLLGGRLDLIYDEISVMSGMIEAGQMRPLIVLAEKRLEKYPDVPSAKELGYQVPPSLWRGASLKKGTPDDIVMILETAFTKAAATDAYMKFEDGRLLNLYPGRLGSADFAKVIADEYGMYKDVIESLKK
jgi:putative tricarboxylic transport membrane protein